MKKEAEPLEPSPEFKRQVFGQDANGKAAAAKSANLTNIGKCYMNYSTFLHKVMFYLEGKQMHL